MAMNLCNITATTDR